jgi:hypothetical protein
MVGGTVVAGHVVDDPVTGVLQGLIGGTRTQRPSPDLVGNVPAVLGEIIEPTLCPCPTEHVRKQSFKARRHLAAVNLDGRIALGDLDDGDAPDGEPKFSRFVPHLHRYTAPRLTAY